MWGGEDPRPDIRAGGKGDDGGQGRGRGYVSVMRGGCAARGGARLDVALLPGLPPSFPNAPPCGSDPAHTHTQLQNTK